MERHGALTMAEYLTITTDSGTGTISVFKFTGLMVIVSRDQAFALSITEFDRLVTTADHVRTMDENHLNDLQRQEEWLRRFVDWSKTTGS
jgi:hypothetical protein